jgi:hypothetical protein
MSGPLAACEEAALAVRQIETTLEEARERLRAALVTAHAAGASIALLARTVGLSHQRVSQILAAEK